MAMKILKSKASNPFRRSDRTRPTNCAADFTQGQLTDTLDISIANPPVLVAELDHFVDSEETDEVREKIRVQERSLFSGATEELKQLEKTTAKYKKEHHLEAESVSTSGSDGSTWQQVMTEVNLARAREEGQDEAAWNAKNLCTRMTDNIPAFENWLQLLPNGDYGAVICGVFKLVVSATIRANEVRVTIFQALADIPDWVEHATRYREIYGQRKPQALINLTAELCKAVVVALNSVMLYFNESLLKRALKAVGQGSNYKMNLLSNLERVKDISTKVERETIVLLQERLQSLDDHIRRDGRVLREKIDVIMEQQKAQPDKIVKLLATNFYNTVYHQLLSEEQSSGTRTKAHRRIEAPGPSSCEPGETSGTVRKERLLVILGSLESVSGQDVDRCLAKSKAADPERAKWILHSFEFREWLSGTGSRTLLINGNVEGNETFSATTFITAKLSESFCTFQSVLTLSFFCSLHVTNSGDVEAGAKGMMKCLLTQLLLCDIPWDLEQRDVEKLEQGDLEALCQTLRKLFQQLPAKSPVFCMIDGITYYERHEKRPDFVSAVQSIINLIEERDDLVVKLLLTCHGRSNFIKRLVDNEDTLLVPSTINGDGQIWSNRAWDRIVDVEMEEHGDADE